MDPPQGARGHGLEHGLGRCIRARRALDLELPTGGALDRDRVERTASCGVEDSVERRGGCVVGRDARHVTKRAERRRVERMDRDRDLATIASRPTGRNTEE